MPIDVQLKPVRVAAVAALLLTLLSVSCYRKSRVPGRIAFQEVILARQVEGIKTLIETMRDSSLIPRDQALIIVDQDLVRDLLTAAMPFERDVGNGILVRVSSATVLFEDGLALVQLDGRAEMNGGDFYTDVTVYGDLNSVELDPEEGVLKGRVNVIAFDDKKTSIGGLSASLKELVDDMTDIGLADLSKLNYTIEIPVRIANRVRLPAIGEPGKDVYIGEAAIPMNVSVANVESFRGKLWISINLTVPEAERRGEAQPRRNVRQEAPEPTREEGT